MKLLVHALIGVFKVLLYVTLLKETTMAGKMKRKLKGATKSKTMMANAAIVAGVAADVLANSGGIISAIGGPTAVAGVTFLNMILRAWTDRSLEEKAY